MKVRDFRRQVVAAAFPEYSRLSRALGELKFVQADPIRAPARAQDLILRQRVRGYAAGELERSFQDLEAEEGYLFAYGFMTPEVWEGLRRRPLRNGLKKKERAVLEAVAELGEVHPRDLDERFGRKSVEGYWGGRAQETKQILDKLHHHGVLRVSRREKGIRVYQVPGDDGERTVDPRDRYALLLETTALVFGPTTKSFLVTELRSHNHLLPTRRDRLAAVDALVEAGRLEEIEVAGVSYLWRPRQGMDSEIPERVRILAPFDPLVRDRERFEQLWDWTYRFEAYVPEAKRERGYYAMPVLWRDDVVGWANAKLEGERLRVELGYARKKPRPKVFRSGVEKEVESMARFLDLESGAWEVSM